MAKTKKPNKTDTNKKKVLEQLEKSLGIVTVACKNSGVSRSQFYTWLNDDEKFAEAVEDMNDIALDFAESSLHKQIQDKVPSSTIFYLKTRGRSRGYIEKSELDITSDGDSISPIQWVKNDSNK